MPEKTHGTGFSSLKENSQALLIFPPFKEIHFCRYEEKESV